MVPSSKNPLGSNTESFCLPFSVCFFNLEMNSEDEKKIGAGINWNRAQGFQENEPFLQIFPFPQLFWP